MPKNQNQNQSGTFAIKKAGFRKYLAYFATTVVVAVFILGSGLYVYKRFIQKSEIKSAVTTNEEIPGWWYKQYFSSSVCDREVCLPESDPDLDKLTNAQEFFYHTDPLNAHTAGDKLDDGQLVAAGFDPSRSGRIAFDQVSSDENILGESLIFGKDIQQMVAEDLDISKVNLNLTADSDLRIVTSEDTQSYKDYAQHLKTTIYKYFRPEDMNYIKEILKSGNDAEINDIKIRSGMLAVDLKTVPVPQKFLMFHKYNIAMYQLLSEVIVPPANISGAEGDAWYEKVQAFLAVQQKLNFEEQALKLGN